MKFVLGIALALGIAATAYGAAASINVNTTELGAGDAELTNCDAGDDGVNVDYTVNWSTVNDRYSVDAVAVSDIEGCDGGTALITLTEADGDALPSGSSSAITIASGTATWDTSAIDFDPADIYDIHIVLTN